MNSITVELSDFYTNMATYLKQIIDPSYAFNCVKINDEGNEWYLKAGRTSPYIGCVIGYSDYENYKMWMDKVNVENRNLVEFLPDADTPGHSNMYVLVKKLRELAIIDNAKASATKNFTTGVGDWDANASVPGDAGNSLYVIVVDPGANDQPLTVTIDTSTLGGVTDDRINISLATGSAGAITTTVQDLISAVASTPGYISITENTAGLVGAEIETVLVGGTEINTVVGWASILLKDNPNDENPSFVFLGADESDKFGI